jgi:AAA domain
MADGVVLTPAKRFAGIPLVKAKEAITTMNFMVYGDSGVGKTRLLGSADEVPDLRKLLYVDIEGGTMSIREHYPNVDVVRIKNFGELKDVYEALRGSNHGYATVCIDSVNEMQKFNMSDIMIELVKSRTDLDPDIPGMREWGKNLEQMRRYIRLFRDLSINTLFTCLSMDDKDQKTGTTRKKPGLSGKLSGEITAFLDIVCYMYMKEVDSKQQRMLLTGSTDTFTAKDRTAKLPMVIPNPSMKTIWNHINGTKEETNA